MASRASSGADHNDNGTPVAAGSWHANDFTSAACTAVNRRGRPDLGRSISPSRPWSANRPRHLRTVSSVVANSAAMSALVCRAAASSTIRARTRSRCGVLCPRARRFSTRRIEPVNVIGQARTADIAQGLVS
jgi:hypothetical protein